MTVVGGVQARMEAVGQALLRRCQEGGMSALGVIRMGGHKARVAADAYEEHLVFRGDTVALLTNRRLLCLHAPGFAAVPDATVACLDELRSLLAAALDSPPAATGV